jgi:hypothetical protein
MARNENQNTTFSIIIGSMLTTAGSILLYSGFRDRIKKKWIEETPYMTLAQLEDLIKKDDNQTSRYIKTSGKIGTDYPIICDLSKERCAIFEQRSQGVWYSLSVKDGIPIDSSFNILRRESPFYIYDETQHKIFVKPFSKNEPKLQIVHMHDEKAGNFLLSLLLGLIKIPYPYKYIHSEHCLPLYRELFVLGNISRHRDGSLHIIAPNTDFFIPNHPGILSLKSEEEILNDLTRKSKKCNIWGSILGMGGMLVSI